MPKHPKDLILEYTVVSGQPKPKTIGIHSADDIDVYNYTYLAAYYGVEDVEVYPTKFIKISKSYAKSADKEKDVYENDSTGIPIPKGYMVFFIDTRAASNGETQVLIGDNFSTINGNSFSFHHLVHSGFRGPSSFPVTWKSFHGSTKEIATLVTVTLYCKVTDEHTTEWKIKLYDKIMQAYNRKQQEFNEWLQQQKAMSDFDGQEIKGNNPEINRRIEKEELKKRCLEMFSGQRWETFDAATAAANNLSNYPEILFEESIKEGVVVKFFEKSFDWENITYEYFPYFYGNKERWCSITQLKDNDPVFENFLKAGFARVVVPVTPGNENIVAQYMITAINMYGFPYHWFSLMGMSSNFIPGIEQVYLKNLFADLRAARELNEETGKVIGTYVEKVPTNLVYLASLDPDKGTPDLPDFTNHPQINPNITGVSINETIDPSLLTTNVTN